MLKLKNDFSCVLRDKKTGSELLTFSAMATGDAVFSAAFEGGGVASSSQNRTIFTETKFDYKPYQHEVIVDGVTYLIVSVVPSMRRRMGAGTWVKPRAVYILTLE